MPIKSLPKTLIAASVLSAALGVYMIARLVAAGMGYHRSGSALESWDLLIPMGLAVVYLYGGLGSLLGKTVSVAVLALGNTLLLFFLIRSPLRLMLPLFVPAAAIEILLLPRILPAVIPESAAARRGWGWGLAALCVLFVPLSSIFPPGKYLDLATEENWLLPFMFLGPAAIILWLLQKQDSGRKILLLGFAALIGMHFVAESLGHRYGILDTRYSESQKGAGVAILCIFGGWLALLTAAIGLAVRRVRGYLEP